MRFSRKPTQLMRSHLISTKGDRRWQGIPSIERAANGRLWCAFFSGGPREPDLQNHILLTTSDDDGTTWAPPTVVVDPPGQTRAYDPCLWLDPAGRLWLFYNLAAMTTKLFAAMAIVADDPTGATPAWSDPRHVDVSQPFAFRLNKPIVLSTGAWVLPITWADRAPTEDWFPFDRQRQGVGISSDRGLTWSLHGGVEAPPWALENMVVELNDRTLWMLIRTGAGVLWQSFSGDGGRTWSTGAATDIVNPGARFFLGRLDSGRLLLIHTPHASLRKGLRASLSEPADPTRFRPTGLELDGHDNISYPDALQATDGTIYAVHDHDRAGQGAIHLTVFHENEIP